MKKSTGFKSLFILPALTVALVGTMGASAFAAADATTSGAASTATPSVTATVGVDTVSGTVKKVETVTDNVFLTINDGKTDKAFYAVATSEAAKAALALKNDDKVTVKYALGTPMKYNDTTAMPLNSVTKDTAPAAVENPVGAAEAKGTVKKIETIEKQVFLTLNDGKEDRVFYAEAASDNGKAVLLLKNAMVVTIKYALGTPVKYHETMASPINNVAGAVTPETIVKPVDTTKPAETAKPATPPTGISVLVNGTAVTFDVKPQIIKDTTMVPVRAILEKMGYTLNFDAKTGTIKATAEKSEVVLVIGNPVVKMGDKSVTALVAPTIVEGRTLIPLRALGEISGYTVKWDQATQTASLTK